MEPRPLHSRRYNYDRGATPCQEDQPELVCTTAAKMHIIITDVSSEMHLLDPSFVSKKVQMIYNLANRTVYAFLAGFSIVGNISVFVNNMYSFKEGTKTKSIHLIIMHLAFTNIIMLVSKGVPRIITVFGVRNFLDDVGCKIVCYMERVARGLSICTSGLLTVVQAVTMSPGHSAWRRLKLRSAWQIFHLLLSFWIFNSLIGVNLVYSITNVSVNTSQVSKSDTYCVYLPGRQKMKLVFLTVMVLRDAVFQGLMGGSSVYMVYLLHKHHQRVLHLQRSKFLYKTPPEVKAAQSILLLMLCFLFFYWIDCILALFINFENHPMVINIREFLTVGYAILSPFVLIHRDGHLADFLKETSDFSFFSLSVQTHGCASPESFQTEAVSLVLGSEASSFLDWPSY
ncbi:vomeronasal type-1 receptor 4-like [Erethizon dorsatum]